MNIPQLSSFREAFSDAVAHQRVMDEFDKAARRAVDAGAEVLIPCGSHAVLQARRALREIEGALIMDGLAVLMITPWPRKMLRPTSSCQRVAAIDTCTRSVTRAPFPTPVIVASLRPRKRWFIDKSCHCISASQAHDALRDRDGSNGLRHP
jgi:hypothetical protein